MAHGAGGKATQTLIEGLLAPAFDNETLNEMADAGVLVGRRRRARDDHRLLRRQAAAVPGRVDRRAGRQRDGQRSERVGGAAAGAEPVARARGGTGGRRAARRGRGDRRRGERRRRADHRRRHEGRRARPRRRDVRLHDRDRPAATRARRLSPASLRPGDRILLSGSIGEHGTAIMLARDEFELDAEIESDTRSLWPAVDALLDAVGPELRCMRDATRGGVASVLNELARASSVAMIVREGEIPVKPEVAGAAEILGIDPMYVANEGKMVVFVAPEAADEALSALRVGARMRASGRDRRGADGAARDGAGADEFWRQTGDGPAGRRSAAADLLSNTREETGWRARPTQSRKRPRRSPRMSCG